MAKANISKGPPKSTKSSTANAIASTSARKISSPKQPPPKASPPKDVAPPIVQVEGELHLFDTSIGMFVQQDDTIELKIQMVKKDYWIIVEGAAGVWISQKIESEMSLNFSLVSLLFFFASDGE